MRWRDILIRAVRRPVRPGVARLLQGRPLPNPKGQPEGAKMRLPILVACSLLLGCGSAAAADPQGAWLVEDKSAQIEVGICSGILWGIVFWEKTAGRDTENPDPALRSRPTLGIPILLGMRPQQPPQAQPQQRPDPALTVWHGTIYNSLNGRTYDASVKLTGPDVLHLEGCVLGGLFCGGQNWTRVKTPATTAASAAADVCSRVPDLTRGTH
jgi:Uncharacterized protein conserved in bacteria (DUF2147)